MKTFRHPSSHISNTMSFSTFKISVLKWRSILPFDITIIPRVTIRIISNVVTSSYANIIFWFSYVMRCTITSSTLYIRSTSTPLKSFCSCTFSMLLFFTNVSSVLKAYNYDSSIFSIFTKLISSCIEVLSPLGYLANFST